LDWEDTTPQAEEVEETRRKRSSWSPADDEGAMAESGRRWLQRKLMLVDQLSKSSRFRCFLI
jgi:hypothetical protein